MAEEYPSGTTKTTPVSKPLMSWTTDRDIIFCREILVSNLFETKKSSTGRGKVWEAIAEHLSGIREPSFKVDQRSVRDHYKKLVSRAKRKVREEKSASGISPTRTELDALLEEIIEREETAEMMRADEDDENRKKVEADRVAADDMRRKAMEKLAETKRRKGDDDGNSRKKRMVVNETVVYLREKTQMEMNIRKEELELKKAETEMKDKQLQSQASQQDQYNNVIKLMIEQHQQQQQQTQSMHMMMLQQQQQQTQAMLTLIEKLSK